MEVEKRKEGTVGLGTYWRYIKSTASIPTIVLWIVLALGAQVSASTSIMTLCDNEVVGVGVGVGVDALCCVVCCFRCLVLYLIGI